MSIGTKDRKILWTRSGNCCAFPGCGQHLVERGSEADGDVVIGQEAHIVARRPGGPRGRSQHLGANIDSYNNIILLCPTHHSVVDQQPSRYSAAKLSEMKKRHESSVAERMKERSHRIGLSDWRVGNSLVVIEPFGCLPVWVDSRWRASGLVLGQQALHHIPPTVNWFYTSSEADPEIEYWSDGYVFNVAESIASDNGFLPSICYKYDFRKFPATRTNEIMIDIDPSWKRPLTQLVAQIRSFDDARSMDWPDVEARLCSLLFRVWKAGLVDPHRVQRVFGELEGLWWFDGCMAQYVNYLSRELAKIQEATSSPAEGFPT